MKTRDNIKLSTRERIMTSFKELVLTEPIEKITVGQIAENAEVIRPTFYNYFEDKYDLLRSVIEEELSNPITPLIENNLFYEALTLLFSIARRNKTFYMQAAKLEGVESFKKIVTELIREILLKGIVKHVGEDARVSGFLTPEDLADYYAYSMGFVIVRWIKSGMELDPDHMANIYMAIINNSFEDILDKFEKVE